MSSTRPLRVIVADDSLSVRKRIVHALSSSGDIEVVAEARDGRELVSLCAALRPDAVTLDVVMPGMDGVRATEEIMANSPTPILIVSAAENRPPGVSTQSALAAGAIDVLDKPSDASELATFDERLQRAVRLIARIRVITHPRARLRRATLTVDDKLNTEAARSLVALGASTGGPAAIAEILRELRAGFPLPILVVLHLGPSFGFEVSDWLAKLCRLPVATARHGAEILPGHVYVCPPDQHLTLNGDRLWLTHGPERNFCRPSIDVLFESVAEQLGARAVGCLLTGIGRDGARGLLAMRERGALTLAQDEASSAVFGMPREAIALGAAEYVGNPANIASVLQRLVRPR